MDRKIRASRVVSNLPKPRPKRVSEEGQPIRVSFTADLGEDRTNIYLLLVDLFKTPEFNQERVKFSIEVVDAFEHIEGVDFELQEEN